MQQVVDQVPSLSGNPRRFAEFTQNGEAFTACLARDAPDPAWDTFLEQTPLGQFQQSTFWARTKAAEGWQSLRVIVHAKDTVIAGFQIMTRPAWRGHGRIGYISKGPVVLPERPAAVRFTARLLQQAIREEKLSALIAQPPDLCSQMPEALRASGFLPDFLMKVNDATWNIDLDGNFEAIEAAMGRTTRNLVRRAIRTGFTIRQGHREDLEQFFHLMLATCRRQQASPNPSRFEYLQALWDAASPSGNIRLFLAEYQGRILAGLLVILFGKTATLWKVGAAPPDKELKPNDYLYHQAIRWAQENGSRQCDFAAFDRPMALSLLHGKSLTEDQLRTRYLFLTRFGGRPTLLPGAQIYFPNPWLRAAYRSRFHRRFRQAATEPDQAWNAMQAGN